MIFQVCWSPTKSACDLKGKAAMKLKLVLRAFLVPAVANRGSISIQRGGFGKFVLLSHRQIRVNLNVVSRLLGMPAYTL